VPVLVWVRGPDSGLGFSGYTRRRGRRHRRCRTSFAQVVADAKTLPILWA
jgi:hypothetical protein